MNKRRREHIRIAFLVVKANNVHVEMIVREITRALQNSSRCLYELDIFTCEEVSQLSVQAAKIVARGYIGIFAFGRTAVIEAKKAAQKIVNPTPVVYMGFNDPVGEGLINSLDKSCNNLTGVILPQTLPILPAQMIIRCQKMVRRIMIIYSSQERRVAHNALLLKDYFSKKRIKAELFEVKHKKIDADKQVEKIRAKMNEFDSAMLVNGDLIIHLHKAIAKMCDSMGKTLFASSLDALESGAVFGFLADFKYMAVEAAESMRLIIEKGRFPSEIPTKIIENSCSMYINKGRAKSQGVFYSEEVVTAIDGDFVSMPLPSSEMALVAPGCDQFLWFSQGMSEAMRNSKKVMYKPIPYVIPLMSGDKTDQEAFEVIDERIDRYEKGELRNDTLVLCREKWLKYALDQKKKKQAKGLNIGAVISERLDKNFFDKHYDPNGERKNIYGREVQVGKQPSDDYFLFLIKKCEPTRSIDILRNYYPALKRIHVPLVVRGMEAHALKKELAEYAREHEVIVSFYRGMTQEEFKHIPLQQSDENSEAIFFCATYSEQDIFGILQERAEEVGVPICGDDAQYAIEGGAFGYGMLSREMGRYFVEMYLDDIYYEELESESLEVRTLEQKDEFLISEESCELQNITITPAQKSTIGPLAFIDKNTSSFRFLMQLIRTRVSKTKLT